MRMLNWARAAALTGIGMAGVLVLTGPAAAQVKACVYLQPGAGYSAKMRIVWGTNGSTSWSSDFPIGKSQCQTLAGNVPPNTPYSTQVKADLGKTKTCTPDNVNYDPNDQKNAVWNAWGTTLSVKCQQVGN